MLIDNDNRVSESESEESEDSEEEEEENIEMVRTLRVVLRDCVGKCIMF
jgi:hypothetical protein